MHRMRSRKLAGQKERAGMSDLCKWCDAPAHIKQGRIMLCAKHYRMSTMRSKAKSDGKYRPLYAELEALIPDPFECEGCGREMTWLRESGASVQVTLQHDRSGEIRLLCLGCNRRHAVHPGDSFYDIPDGHKWCAMCNQVLPHSEFARDRSRPIGLKGYCRQCSAKRHAKWRTENRDKYNQYQREYRSRKAQLA